MAKYVVWLQVFILLNFIFIEAQTQQEKLSEREKLIAEFDRQQEEARQEFIAKLDERLGLSQPKAFLGVTLRNISPNLRNILDIPATEGVLIEKVVSGGPAETAGIKKMDILLRVNGENVNEVEKVHEAVSKSKPGEILRLMLLHQRKRKNVMVKLGKTISKLPTIARKNKKADPLKQLFGEMNPKDQKQLKELQKMMEDMQKNPDAMMKNLQKMVQKQLKNLQKDPNFKKNMEKIESMLRNNKDLEEVFKELLPKKSKNTTPKKPQSKAEKEIDSLLDDLLDEEKSSNEADLGILVMNIPDAVKERENFTKDYGVLISKVEAGSPAQKAGVKRWDILLSIDSKRVYSATKAKQFLKSFSPGETTELTLFSDGEVYSVSIKIK